MSRRSRSEQARINGAKSRGPKTPEGKAVSSMNAVKHGRFIKDPVRLFFESTADFELLLQDLVAHFRPATYAERRVVEQLAQVEHIYTRTQIEITTYLERILRYSNPQRLKVPPTGNPFDTLVAAKEEAITRSRYLQFMQRESSRLLTDRARLVRLLKAYKRDFVPAELQANPVHPDDPSLPLVEETAETFVTIHEPDFFPKPLGKSNTSPSRNPFETNPFEPYTPPAFHTPDPRDNPSSPPNPLPKAA
jgi:hypothetical protein